ncbi:hypothetical protein Emed_006356 [Eimeria media]
MQRFVGRAAWGVLLLSVLLLLPGLLVPTGLSTAAALEAAESSRESADAAAELDDAAAGEVEAAAAAAAPQEEGDDAAASSGELAAAAAEASSEGESVPRTRRPARTTRGDGSGFPSRRRSSEASEGGRYSSGDEEYFVGGGGELVELMNTVRERRTKALNKMRKGVKHLPYLNTDLLLGVFVTALVVLYALKVRTRRYTFDASYLTQSPSINSVASVFTLDLELTLKMSRQARWFSPVQATYPADDGFTYVVSLDFKGRERAVLPKRYTQQEKEKLISLFERTLQYFETVPPDETSAHLIENWSPSETIQPINILVVRLPYGQDASSSRAKRKSK